MLCYMSGRCSGLEVEEMQLDSSGQCNGDAATDLMRTMGWMGGLKVVAAETSWEAVVVDILPSQVGSVALQLEGSRNRSSKNLARSSTVSPYMAKTHRAWSHCLRCSTTFARGVTGDASPL